MTVRIRAKHVSDYVLGTALVALAVSAGAQSSIQNRKKSSSL